MLGLVLKRIPPHLHERARVGLLARWSRDWGVEGEAIDPSASAFEPWRSRIKSDGPFQPHAGLAGN
jgi:hypothetical protein